MQCSCIALFAHYWSTIRKVSAWQSHDIDHIANISNDVDMMFGVSMHLIVVDQPASIELYDHIFHSHLLGLETREITLENKSVPRIEEIISSSIIKY